MGTPTIPTAPQAAGIRDLAVAAEQRIRPFIRQTPLEHSAVLSRLGGCEAFLKLENVQITASFKLRGAASRLLALSEEERERGIIAASTGNHGTAVAHMLGVLGLSGTIIVPKGTSPAKLERLRQLGTEPSFVGSDCLEAELEARTTAAGTGRVFISPYNDLQVIGGQGTIGLELGRQLDRIDVVLVPVGGGGLISGIGGVCKAADPSVEIVGCLPAASPVMYESVKAGRIVDMESIPTLSDGTAGGIEPGAVTVGLCRDLVDHWEVVVEDEIAAALRLIIEQHSMLIEGAAALPVAAFLRQPERYRRRRVVLILSGAKISLDTLRMLLA